MDKNDYLATCPTCGHEILLKSKLLNQLESLFYEWGDCIKNDEFYNLLKQTFKIWQAYKAHTIIPSIDDLDFSLKDLQTIIDDKE